MNKCQDCAAWVRIIDEIGYKVTKNVNGVNIKLDRSVYGGCRRKSPVVLDLDERNGVWPETHEDEGCMDFTYPKGINLA